MTNDDARLTGRGDRRVVVAGRATPRATDAGERGEALTMIVVFTVVLVAIMFVVQYSLAYYARQVLSGAASDGAASAARVGSSVTDGVSLTDRLLSSAAGSLFVGHPSISGSDDGEVVTITVRGKVVSLIPGFHAIDVAAHGSAHAEHFVPEGSP